jgi:hypothetical protein
VSSIRSCARLGKYRWRFSPRLVNTENSVAWAKAPNVSTHNSIATTEWYCRPREQAGRPRLLAVEGRSLGEVGKRGRAKLFGKDLLGVGDELGHKRSGFCRVDDVLTGCLGRSERRSQGVESVLDLLALCV